MEQAFHYTYADEVVGEDAHLQGAYALNPIVATKGVIAWIGSICHHKAFSVYAISECSVSYSLDNKSDVATECKGIAHLKSKIEEEFAILIVLVSFLTAVAHQESTFVIATSQASMLVETFAHEAIDHGVALNPHTHIVRVTVVIVGYLCLDIPYIAFLSYRSIHLTTDTSA
jgi:hypothetical protein